MPQVKLDIFHIDTNAHMGALDISDHSSFPLALSFSIADLKDITKRTGASAKTFRIPATKNNNRLLNYIYNANIETTQYLPDRKAQVTVDGIIVFSGRLKIKAVSQTNAPEEYEMELVGDNLDWVQLLKEVSIKDLEYIGPAPYDNPVQTYSSQVIEQTWPAGARAAGWDYVYSLKNYGAWTGINADPNTASSPQRYVRVEDMRPDVYILSIIQKAFRKIGYRFESSFLTGGYRANLILAFTGTGFSHSETKIQNALFRAKTAVSVCFFYPDSDDPTELGSTYNFLYLPLAEKSPNPDYFDYGNNLTLSPGTGGITIHATSYYTVPWKMSAKFSLTCTLNGFFGNVDGVIVDIVKLVSSGLPVVYGRTFLYDGILDEDNWEAFVSVDVPNFMVFEQGDRIAVRLSVYTDSKSPIPLILMRDLEFSNEIESVILRDEEFEIKNMLPDIPVLDVLAGLNNMFNLYYYTDVNQKKVVCEPRSEFYKPRTSAIDWTNKLDIGKDISTEFIDSYNRSLIFNFKKDGKDKLWESESKELGREWGSNSCELPDRFKVGKQELGTKTFAYTLMHRDNLLHTDPESGPEIPTLWKEAIMPSAPSYDFEPRILEYKGAVTQYGEKGQLVKWQWESVGNLRNTVPLATSEPYLNYYGNEGLMEAYYKADIETIKDGRMFTAWFYLKPTDIMKIDLSRPIYLKHHNLQGYYYINKIVDYQPHRVQSTKVELIRVVDGIPLNINYSAIAPGISPNAPSIGNGSGIPPDNVTVTTTGTVVLGGTSINSTTLITAGSSRVNRLGSATGFPGGWYAVEGVIAGPGMVSVTTTVNLNQAHGFADGKSVHTYTNIQVSGNLLLPGEPYGLGIVAVQGLEMPDDTLFVEGEIILSGTPFGEGQIQIEVSLVSDPNLNKTSDGQFTFTSAVLNNGSGNWAVRNSGSTAFGLGNIALRYGQHITGNYNIPGYNDVFQVGMGTSHQNRMRGLTLNADGLFLVQGGYLYTSDGQEILFASQKNSEGVATRFDKLHLKGNQ